MLQSLHIQNYALIENLDLSLCSGFSVITGETGAGKSIILGALGMLLGQRADVKSIKPGASRCVVEAVFGLKNLGMQRFFEENNLDFDGTECIVRRELSDSGKNRAFINDSLVPVSLLKELGPHLIDIHSQHQNLLVGEEHFQLNVLDTVADDKDLLVRYQALFKTLQTSEAELKTFQEKVEQERLNMDFLKFQLEEIGKAHLGENEQQELEDEAAFLDHAEEIKQGLFDVDALLSTDDTGISSKMYACLHAMENLSRVYPKMLPLIERLRSCSIELDDMAQDISKELEKIHFDPERQIEVNDRLNTIYALEKKFKCDTIAAVLSHAAELRNQLGNLEDSDDKISDMRKENEQLLKATLEVAAQLSQVRRTTASKVEVEMQKRLQNLGMMHICFQVSVKPLLKPAPDGMDEVVFLFSSNKNAPLQNIADIASGGEIARVMLSLKALLTSRKQSATIIFDEIDTGVSGRIAEKMAIMMREMSQGGRQVISITHLPQIAALGQYHYKVYKEDNEQTTATYIRELTAEERVTEIAHMLSGSTLTDAAVSNAKELLNQKTI